MKTVMAVLADVETPLIKGRSVVSWMTRACQGSVYDVSLVSVHSVEIASARATVEITSSNFDVTILLQPYYPQLRGHHIDAAISKLDEFGCDEVFSTDMNLVQNGVLSIGVRGAVFSDSVNKKSGCIICDLIKVESKEDIRKVERAWVD